MTMRHTIHTILIVIGLLLLLTSKTTGQSNPSLDDQVKEIMSMWPGHFHNDAQIKKATMNGYDIWRKDDSGEGGYLDVTAHYVHLSIPSLGQNVLYVEEYRDSDPQNTYRQRIYTVEAHPDLKAVKVKMWPFQDKKKYIGAFDNPELLSTIAAEDVSAYPNKCDLWVRKAGGSYYMYMNGSDCTFGDKVFNYQVRLSPDEFSYRDKIFSISENKVVTTAANFSYHNLDRK